MLEAARSNCPRSDPIDIVLHALGLDPRQRAHIETRATALGVGSEAVAIGWGFIDEDAFYRTLARELGIEYLTQSFTIDRHFISPHGYDAGMTRSVDGRIIMAPRGEALRMFLTQRPPGVVLTSPRLLRDSLRAGFRTGDAVLAASALPIVSPRQTAHRDGSASGFVIAAWLVALVALAFCEPVFAWPVTVPLFLLFAWTIGQRIMAIGLRRDMQRQKPPRALSPMELPFYSVLVPLFKEERVVPQLIGALEALDYPPEKLEILILVEEQDMMTRHALAAIRLLPHMRMVLCPNGAPRTKPRALNIGLSESRGEFIAVYDAEDRPDADQLIKAAALFRQSRDLACLQAEIAIENGDTNLLTRCFALEYAALFQIIVHGLCVLNLPVALGGTSNHFRRDVLRALNGWDAWNVTEDADLGLRLALRGYRIGHLQSRTWEEAPARLQDWRQQRMRWIKGWMQTSLVHLHDLRRHWRKLSFFSRVGVLHHLVGTPVAALLTPLFSMALIAGYFSGRTGFAHQGFMALGSALAVAACGMMVALYRAAAPELRASSRRQALLAMPLYLLFVSVCAWLALAELVRAPFHWNKTPHGAGLPALTPAGGHPRKRRRRWSVPGPLPSQVDGGRQASG